MGIALKQNDDGSAGLQGVDGDDGAIIFVECEYDPSSVDKLLFIVPRKMVVKSIAGRVNVAGTDAAAVSATIRKVNNTQAITGGTALHTGSFDLKGTANNIQNLTISPHPAREINVGQAIAVDFTGVLTAAEGVITIGLCPA
jgi:hypothetical protein